MAIVKKGDKSFSEDKKGRSTAGDLISLDEMLVIDRLIGDIRRLRNTMRPSPSSIEGIEKRFFDIFSKIDEGMSSHESAHGDGYLKSYKSVLVRINLLFYDILKDKYLTALTPKDNPRIDEGSWVEHLKKAWRPEDLLNPRESRKELKDEELRAKIHAKVDELSGQALSQFWASLADPQPKPETKPILTAPPDGQFYEQRADKSENAPDFIQRVYGEWLDGTFTRADLRRLDPKAAMGLQNWEKNHRQKADIKLPTLKEKNDRFLETDPNSLDKYKRLEQQRLKANRYRRPK